MTSGCYIGTTVTKEQKKFYTERARSEGMPLSEYMRRCLELSLPQSDTKMSDPLLKMKDVCRELNISRQEAIKLMEKKELPFVKINASYRFRKDDIEALKNSYTARAESMEKGPDLISTSEAARILAVSQTTLYAWIKDGKVKAVRVGKRYKLEKKDVEEMARGGH